ncbi:DMT family transporter [Vibrio makurazakiensis]|uniref:DMT family transporter n=1 Tax=Vibrio makurazakiensis TaxID=2910250 RepID=UPI003D09D5E1
MAHIQPSNSSHPLADYWSQLPDSAKGIGLALISNALFIVVGVMVRLLSETIDAFQILLFRQLIFIVLLTPAIIRNVDSLMSPKMVPVHLLRVSGAFIALYLGFLTVSNIPFADATALGFLKVLFVAIISRVALTEAVGRIRLLTIAIGFVGVLMVVQPTFDTGSSFYIMTGIVASIGAATAAICVRKLSAVESKTVVLTYQAVFVGVVTLIPSIVAWQWPNVYELALLMLVGVVSSIAQWFGVTAYKWGEANVVSNVEYSQMIYSVILGYWLFSEMPNQLALIGVAVIIASSFLPYLNSVLAKKTKA